MTSRASVERFVAAPAMAIVGVSRSGRKFGNLALRTLKGQGYRVYPVHPSADRVDGVQCYRSFADLPEKIDAALVVVPPTEAVKVIAEAARAGIKRVWLQQGAESAEAAAAAAACGVELVAGECILMFAHPASYHRVHRWVRGLVGRLPA